MVKKKRTLKIYYKKIARQMMTYLIPKTVTVSMTTNKRSTKVVIASRANRRLILSKSISKDSNRCFSGVLKTHLNGLIGNSHAIPASFISKNYPTGHMMWGRSNGAGHIRLVKKQSLWRRKDSMKYGMAFLLRAGL